jgi:hypothetical protein
MRSITTVGSLQLPVFVLSIEERITTSSAPSRLPANQNARKLPSLKGIKDAACTDAAIELATQAPVSCGSNLLSSRLAAEFDGTFSLPAAETSNRGGLNSDHAGKPFKYNMAQAAATIKAIKLKTRFIDKHP